MRTHCTAALVVLLLTAGCLHRSLAPVQDGRRVTFYCPGNNGAPRLVGDFNGWRAARPMKAAGGRYSQTLTLAPGDYAYACRYKNGRIKQPLDAPAYVDDGFGGLNGWVHVRGPKERK